MLKPFVEERSSENDRSSMPMNQRSGILTAISRKHWNRLLIEIEDARCQRHLLTYRSLIERLHLPSPAMATLTAALDHLAALDAEAGRPLRSSLVISQGISRLPKSNFFEYAQRLGRFSGMANTSAAAGWHASEVARVFEFDYPDIPPISTETPS